MSYASSQLVAIINNVVSNIIPTVSKIKKIIKSISLISYIFELWFQSSI